MQTFFNTYFSYTSVLLDVMLWLRNKNRKKKSLHSLKKGRFVLSMQTNQNKDNLKAFSLYITALSAQGILPLGEG